MMRRSGDSPAGERWKFSFVMFRRAGSGHIPATQLLKLEAASRIAAAVINGWPEAPSSPVHGKAPPGPGGACEGAGFEPEKIPPNRFDKTFCAWACALTGGSTAAASIIAPV